jgi:DNA replication initiation complex subunit (GINS family)
VEESPSALQLREFENATATIREIALLRQQKILFRALRNPSSSPTEGELAREEYQTFDRFCAIIGEERGRLDALLARFEHRGLRRQERSAGAGSAPAEGAKVKKVRFLKEVQAYIGANHETFGPFKPGEEGKLPSEEADLLLKQRMAEIVE